MSVSNRVKSTFCALVNAVVITGVLLGLFIGLNRGRMPGGIAEFLSYRTSIRDVLLAGLFILISVVAFRAFGLTSPVRFTPFGRELLQIAKACTVASLFLLLGPVVTISGAFTWTTVAIFLPMAIAACTCGRLISTILVDHLGSFLKGRRDLIIVGSGPQAETLYKQVCAQNSNSTRVLGFVDSPTGQPVPELIRKQMLGGLDDLEDILMRLPVDEVLITLPPKSCYEQIQTAIAVCERGGVEAKYQSDVFEVLLARPRFEPDGETRWVSLKIAPDDHRLLVKRAVDILGASAGLIVLAPVMLITALLIRLTSEGPVLFTQERYGLHKRRFLMYKFRTMVVNAESLQSTLESQNEATGPVFKIRNDPRVTPIGRFLRKTSIDELPQLFNVLRGNMSLVGPRPLPKRDVSRFNDASLMRRFSVKPGLTCLWQVNGRSNTDFTRWIVLDLKYIDEWSLKLDFAILAKTVPAVLLRNGAS